MLTPDMLMSRRPQHESRRLWGLDDEALQTLARQFVSPMMDEAELFHLARNMLASVPASGKFTAVEIGAFKGGTTVFCQTVLKRQGVRTRWIAIDPFDLFGEADNQNPQGVAGEFLTNIKNSGLPDDTVAIVATSERAAEFVQGPIDFLIIDGYHSYEVCKFDLDAYAPKLRIGGGLFVDDYMDAYPGVMRACDEFLSARPRQFTASKHWFLDARRVA
jgi:hypothetical protein